MPLQRRVPKFGFRTHRVEYKGINLDALQTLAEGKGLKASIPPCCVRTSSPERQR